MQDAVQKKPELLGGGGGDALVSLVYSNNYSIFRPIALFKLCRVLHSRLEGLR